MERHVDSLLPYGKEVREREWRVTWYVTSGKFHLCYVTHAASFLGPLPPWGQCLSGHLLSKTVVSRARIQTGTRTFFSRKWEEDMERAET